MPMPNPLDAIKSGLRNFLQIRFQPSMDLLVVLLSFLAMVAGLYATWKTVSIASVFVPVSMLVLGIIIPIAYNSFVKKRPLSETGISKKYWLRSLVLGLILAIAFLAAPAPAGTAFMAAVTSLTFTELLPLLALEITAGLFWVIFFQGWVQMRFERAFGAIPAILIAAAFFALHHAGYGEPVSLSHMTPLFMAGIINSTIFRITRNIFILWPFFISTTGLSSDLMTWNFRLPFESTYGYISVLALMLSFVAIVRWRQKRMETAKLDRGR